MVQRCGGRTYEQGESREGYGRIGEVRKQIDVPLQVWPISLIYYVFLYLSARIKKKTMKCVWVGEWILRSTSCKDRTGISCQT
jgi:hypothetical protein